MSEPRPKDRLEVSETVIEALLEHVVRYRLTVFPALQRLPAFTGFPPGRIKDVLKAARMRHLLDSASLHGGASYWHLTGKGAEKCGIRAERSGPLSEPAKFRAYSMLRFCCLSEQPRHRLLPAELKRHFPDLDRPGLPTGYYLDPSGAKRLGFLRVDTGHRGRWDRVLQTLRDDIRDDIRDHAIQPAFARLVAVGRFEITLLTIFRQKADRITECLAALPEARRVPVKVAATPELLPLIAGQRPAKGGARTIQRH